jgi:hypothetical protein
MSTGITAQIKQYEVLAEEGREPITLRHLLNNLRSLT